MVRVPVSHTGGHRFDSCFAHLYLRRLIEKILHNSIFDNCKSVPERYTFCFLGGLMNDILGILYELESLDSSIFDIKRRMGNMPGRRAELQKKYDEIHGKIDALDNEEEQLKSEMKEISAMRNEHKAKISSDKDYLGSVKSNEEYMLVLNEIGKMEEDIRNGDLRTAEINARLEEIGEQKKAMSGNEGDGSIKEAIENLNEDLRSDEQSLLELESHRDAVIRSLPDDIAKKYRRIYEKRDGIAICLLESRHCPGCYSEIPQQLIEDVKLTDRVNFCMHCGRILLLKKYDNNC